MKFVIFGLTLSSSWGNGHATLWRGLCRALIQQGHRVIFFERDVPYYASHRDFTELPGGELRFREWQNVVEKARQNWPTQTSAWSRLIARTDSRVGDGAQFVRAPSRLLRSRYTRHPGLPAIRQSRSTTSDRRRLADFDLVLSYTGGRALEELKTQLGARRVAPLYGSVDPEVHGRSPDGRVAVRSVLPGNLRGRSPGHVGNAFRRTRPPFARSDDFSSEARSTRKRFRGPQYIFRPPRRTPAASGVLLVVACDIQRHAARDEGNGLLSFRAFIRGSGVRHSACSAMRGKGWISFSRVGREISVLRSTARTRSTHSNRSDAELRRTRGTRPRARVERATADPSCPRTRSASGSHLG